MRRCISQFCSVADVERNCFSQDYERMNDVHLIFPPGSIVNEARCITVITTDDNDVEEFKDFFVVLRQESALGDSVILDDSFTNADGTVVSNATVVIISEIEDCKLLPYVHVRS